MEKEAAEKPDLKMNVLYDIACTLPKYLEVTVCFVQQKFNGIVTLTDPERVVASNPLWLSTNSTFQTAACCEVFIE